MNNTVSFLKEGDTAATSEYNSASTKLEDGSRNATIYKHSAFKFKDFITKEDGYFSGYASTFGNIDLDGDIIAKGAFAESLASGKSIKLLSQHNRHENPVGIITRAIEDDIGLFIEGMLTLGVEKAREIRELLKVGALDSFSIGFSVKEFEENEENTIFTKIDIFEVSFVTFPANPQAKISTIKNDKKIHDINNAISLKDIEKFLRNKGLSRNESEIVISKIKSIKQGDPVPVVINSQSDSGEYIQLFSDVLNDIKTTLIFNSKLKEMSYELRTNSKNS